MEILTIGVRDVIIESLTSNMRAIWHHAETISEACRLLEDLEVSTILVGAGIADEDAAHQLLGHSSLTTSIFILCEHSIAKDLSDLGVHRIGPPADASHVLERLAS